MTERKKFWEKLPPSDHREKHLSTKGVKVAKAKARIAGRPYPTLIDNVTAARVGHTKGAKS